MIYFIRAGHDPLVKIGYTANIRRRLPALQTSTPHALEVLRLIPGTVRQEKELHARFRSHHVRGEWFRLASEVWSYIADTERQDVRDTAMEIPESWRKPGLHECLSCGFRYDGSEAREHAEHHLAWTEASAALGQRVRAYCELERVKAAAWRTLGDTNADHVAAVDAIARAHYEDHVVSVDKPLAWLVFVSQYVNPSLCSLHRVAFESWRAGYDRAQPASALPP